MKEEVMEVTKSEQWLKPWSDILDLQSSGMFIPDIELSEDQEQYVVRAELAGVKKEDVSLDVTDGLLTIKGQKKSDAAEGKLFYHSERRFGTFERSIEFPKEVEPEKVKASLSEGILEVTVPKSERSKPKQIKIEIK
jgi:HSP20 family protein